MRFLVWCSLLCGLPLWQTAVLPLAAQEPTPSRPARVQAAAHSLEAAYNRETGLFNGTGWWNSGNGITALVDASRELHTHSFDKVIKGSFATAPHKFPGFLNEFYDDEGWWALAWLDAYDLRHDPRYLQTAAAIFSDMSGGWSDVCGGGIWWKKNERYKNAIANELFLAVATGLAKAGPENGRQQYLDWANKEAKWFAQSGMVNDEGLVNDGLDNACHNNGKQTWSYNQGVVLRGLAELYELNHDASSLELANRIANAAVTKLVDKDGVMHDPCEPKCGEDGVQFKGIFARDLVVLARVSPAAAYDGFLRSNAETVWTRARTPENRFSCTWSGPAEDGATGSLISALDVLTADLTVNGKKGSGGQ